MAWRVFGTVYESSGALTDQSQYQPVIFPKNSILIGCRTWIILVGDPTFTNLSMQIYSNRAGSPGKLLETSTDTRTKAEILLVDDHAVKEIYFTFDDFSVKSNETYNFVLTGSGYTYGASSYLAWRVAWPDPVYTENYTPTTSNLGVAPKFISTFIAGDL